VLGLGLAASVLAALQWRSYVTSQQQRQIATTVATTSASLTTAVARDEDLLEMLGSLAASRSPVTNLELQQLFSSIRATKDTGVIGIRYIVRVPAAQLATFWSLLRNDPPLGLAPRVNLAAAGARRSVSCLVRDAVTAPGAGRYLTPASLAHERRILASQRNYCRGPSATGLDRAAATGTFAVADLHPGLLPSRHLPVANDLFDLILPVYRPGAQLHNATQRRAALLGWVDGLYSSVPILKPVIAGTNDLAVRLSYLEGRRSFFVAAAGSRHSGVWTRTIVLVPGQPWRATIAMIPNAASATIQGIGVLIDLVIIVLLVGLIISLFRARQKALMSMERSNAELKHQTLHDPLTGLPNRELILQRAAALLSTDGPALTAMIVDLDGFNGINDTYGHRVGDEVLRAVAGRLATGIGPDSLFGRLGGDEFVVLHVGASPGELATLVLARLAEPFELPGVPNLLRMSASVGLANADGHDAEDLLRDAHIALNEAKRAGRNRFAIFEPAMHAAARDKLAMTSELRNAIDHDQFFLLYQPVFRLADSRPVAVEALLRWRHPVRGMVSPLEFIPILEETGLIAEVGHIVLQQACKQASEWERRGLPIVVSVNVSAIQLESDQFCSDVAAVLRQSGIDPSRLAIEITESALMRDAPSAVPRLAELKALGIHLAIDDFGTGYSSLSYLRQFPVDILKIDRSFISAMTGSAGGLALVRAMLELGQALNLQTVAEGIEQAAELRMLMSEQCRLGQGYLLAKPLEASQVELFFDHATPVTLAQVLVRS
jgi:diguanylate cyclase (GGDEF)-like protein